MMPLVLSTLRKQPLVLVAIESVLVLVSLILAMAAISEVPALSEAVERGLIERATLFAAITIGCLYYWDFYDPYLDTSEWELTSRLLGAASTSCLLLAGLTYRYPSLSPGPGVPVLGMVLTVAALLTWRLTLITARRREGFTERVVILGTGQVARLIAVELLKRPRLGLRVLGFIDDDPALQGKSIVNPRVIGTSADLPALVEREGIGRVIVALAERRGQLPIDSLLRLKVGGTRVHEAAALYETVTGKILVEGLRPSWIVFSDGFQPSRVTRVCKRAADLVLAAVGSILAAPLMGLVALLIRLESPGPILFRQERVGERERLFVLHKFRSMRCDAEAATGPVWASENDPRITRVGHWIRKLRLDELPQLWNVLRGEMSFAGPRPERPWFVEMLKAKIPFYSERHAVKPGITGWAQIRHAYGNSVEDAMEKLQYDLFYIKHMSVAFDISVLLQTVKVVLLGRGAV